MSLAFLTRLFVVSGVLFLECLVLHYNHGYDEHGTVDMPIHDLPNFFVEGAKNRFQCVYISKINLLFSGVSLE